MSDLVYSLLLLWCLEGFCHQYQCELAGSSPLLWLVVLLRQNDAECSLLVTPSRRVSTMRAGHRSWMDGCFVFGTCSPACFPLDGPGISECLPAPSAWPHWIATFRGEYLTDLLFLWAAYEQFQRRRVEMAFLGTRAENSSVLAFQAQLFRPGLFLSILLSDT